MTNIKNNIWCIIRPNVIDGKLINLGIMGTGFFISKNKFITSYHLFNKNVFIDNSEYSNDYIILKNISGNEIYIKESDNILYIKEKDLTIITLNNNYSFLKLENNYILNENIENFGFPAYLINNLLEYNNGKINIKGISKQEGKIMKLDNNFSINATDITISSKKVIIMNYSSKIGFSGGPLFNNNLKVIGIMSLIVPISYGIYGNKALAISSKEFVEYI